jgi:hypothetical protein
MIDFVLKTSGNKKLTYIGHSQGTSSMMSALSLGYGDLHTKVNLFVAINPIINLKFAHGKLGQLDHLMVKTVAKLIDTLNIMEIQGPEWVMYQDVMCAVIDCDTFLEISDLI